MTDLSDFSHLQPPTDRRELHGWLADQEARIAAKTRAALDRIIGIPVEQFVDTLTATGDMSFFDAIPFQWVKYVDDVLIAELQGMFYAGTMQVYAEASLITNVTDQATFQWVEVINEEAVQYAKQSTNLMADVGMTTWNTVKAAVATGIESGTSIEIVKKVVQQTKKFSEYRADTIARTETLRAYNNGDWAGAQALGQFGPKTKFWIATYDPPRARPSHMIVGAENPIPMKQPFTVDGELMMYPHSPGASAKNTVNCRCVLGYNY